MIKLNEDLPWGGGANILSLFDLFDPEFGKRWTAPAYSYLNLACFFEECSISK
jgi:hypothetical protein